MNAPIITHQPALLSTSSQSHSHSHHALPALQTPHPILLRPCRRGGCPRAHLLPIGVKPTAFAKAIGSEVFGRYVAEIDVSVETKNVVVWLCCGWNYLGFMLVGKAATDWCSRVVMVPGIGGLLWLVGGADTDKMPYGGSGLWR